MSTSGRWLLPEGIEESLPAEARKLEAMRRQLLDLFASWGYEIVMPPFIEYLESLLTGTGHDLDLQTFKLTDQLNGRLMGVRADITPQVARIDAHRLNQDAPTRLCYLGTVLRTRPEVQGGSRSPLQLGAELYGANDIAADIEIISLMLEALEAVGLKELTLDLGHQGVFSNLVDALKLDSEQESILIDILQRKALPELNGFLDGIGIDDSGIQALRTLCELNGGSEVLESAAASLGDYAHEPLSQLTQVVTTLGKRLPDVNVHVDLAELRGYRYHTGLVFSVFVPEYGQAIAKGGRYDDIGRVFGRSRPATGFSADLKLLAALSKSNTITAQPAIFSPWVEDNELQLLVRQLRNAGERVLYQLPGQSGDASAMGCDREIIKQNGKWLVQTVA
ncbi:MAG: ATP phosphoribosyltransferase regulatory subunit [Gammaproteobacteria bacterium]|nr:MAG: ATP phosphoribosyltransferase regulatory subunit [Gammaproteobacteria bacterium]